MVHVASRLAAPPRYMNRTLQIVMLFCSCCGHAAEQYSILKMHIAKSNPPRFGAGPLPSGPPTYPLNPPVGCVPVGLHSSDTCEKQGQCPRSSGRTWRHSANAGGEACRRERQGTHPPRRLHAFGRSHPNPTLTTACLLHNAVRAGPMFEGEHLPVFFAGITRKVRARLARARVPAACACLLPCVSSSGCCACPRPESTCLHAPAARAFSPLVQPSPPVCS